VEEGGGAVMTGGSVGADIGTVVVVASAYTSLDEVDDVEAIAEAMLC
jgi:hypothetical protein